MSPTILFLILFVLGIGIIFGGAKMSSGKAIAIIMGLLLAFIGGYGLLTGLV